jgi:hypothetical protein
VSLFNVPVTQGTAGLVAVLIALLAFVVYLIITGRLAPASRLRDSERAADKAMARLEAELERAHAETDRWRDACELYEQASRLNSQHLGLAIRTTGSAIGLAASAQSVAGGPDASAVAP